MARQRLVRALLLFDCLSAGSCMTPPSGRAASLQLAWGRRSSRQLTAQSLEVWLAEGMAMFQESAKEMTAALQAKDAAKSEGPPPPPPPPQQQQQQLGPDYGAEETAASVSVPFSADGVGSDNSSSNAAPAAWVDSSPPRTTAAGKGRGRAKVGDDGDGGDSGLPATILPRLNCKRPRADGDGGQGQEAPPDTSGPSFFSWAGSHVGEHSRGAVFTERVKPKAAKTRPGKGISWKKATGAEEVGGSGNGRIPLVAKARKFLTAGETTETSGSRGGAATAGNQSAVKVAVRTKNAQGSLKNEKEGVAPVTASKQKIGARFGVGGRKYELGGGAGGGGRKRHALGGAAIGLKQVAESLPVVYTAVEDESATAASSAGMTPSGSAGNGTANAVLEAALAGLKDGCLELGRTCGFVAIAVSANYLGETLRLGSVWASACEAILRSARCCASFCASCAIFVLTWSVEVVCADSRVASSWERMMRHMAGDAAAKLKRQGWDLFLTALRQVADACILAASSTFLSAYFVFLSAKSCAQVCAGYAGAAVAVPGRLARSIVGSCSNGVVLVALSARAAGEALACGAIKPARCCVSCVGIVVSLPVRIMRRAVARPKRDCAEVRGADNATTAGGEAPVVAAAGSGDVDEKAGPESENGDEAAPLAEEAAETVTTADNSSSLAASSDDSSS